MQVQDKFSKENISWIAAMDEVRTQRLEEEHQKLTLQVLIRDWPNSDEYCDRPELIASLEHQINRFVDIILSKDKQLRKPQYKFFRVDEDEDKDCPTILHLAAKQGFEKIAKTIVEYYPGLLYLKTEEHDDKREYLPVEIALQEGLKFDTSGRSGWWDNTCAYLIGKMKNEWIHNLFVLNGSNTDIFNFGEFIQHPNMKKTVVAVLDRLISPHWPYLPQKKERESFKGEERSIEKAWSSVPDNPMNYHFVYHLLDCDESGNLPKIGDKRNANFNLRGKSNLYHIANSQNKEAIQHPVVRMLVMRKWSKFAQWWFGIQASFYLLFLILMSFALIYGSTRSDPNSYIGSADKLRAFCEIATILMVIFYVIEECFQADNEGIKKYIKDPYNWFDWIGLVMTLLVIPLRFSGSSGQWTVASIGYLFNFLRIFKFSCVSRTTGLYTKTLAKICYRDMVRFMAVFIVVFVAFCGSLFMSLRAMNSTSLIDGFSNVMLVGIRALVEQNPVDDDYSKFKWLSVIIILCYMAMVIVILLNILIAQLSYTYAEAKKMAKLQYDIDRVLIITRLEHSRFSRFNLRVRYYQEGDWIGEVKLAKALLEYSEDRYPWESIEEKLEQIRTMMKKVIKRLPVPDN
ncbi:Transient receptor potential cation channel subfamily V member 4 [Exaiptasia diaphana]|nr:Transient receptor potential cation channel subfamily V member 4 [Exaiptasia diaphana]